MRHRWSNRGREDEEGFAAHQRWKGKEFTKPVAEFRECVVCARAMSAGKVKFDARWILGVWLEIRIESVESLIGTSEGTSRARDLRRKAESGERWSVADFDKYPRAE